MKNKWLHRMGSLKLGIGLLILIALVVIVGTVVVQKPLAEPGQIEQVYSPTKARLYDALGLFDLFHAWWFTALLAVMMINITCASLVRFPVVWREVRRHREPEERLMQAMPQHAAVSASLAEVAAALEHKHYRVKEKSLADGRHGLAADRQRYARLAPYFVHFSLLVVLLGGIIDSRFGYRAFMRLNEGEQKAVAQKLSDESPVALPYSVRCEAAGMEQYQDGTPKRYWSKLVVLDGQGREVLRKEIAVNDPMVYRGIRFFQSNFGTGGGLKQAAIALTPRTALPQPASHAASPHGAMAMDQAAASDTANAQVIEVSANSETPVPEYGIRVKLAAYYPDFYMDGNRLASRSDEPNNPALQLEVSRGDEIVPVLVFANYPQFNNSKGLPVRFSLRGLKQGNFTGLQVTSQPGQWMVWLGCTVLAFGLFWAFFFAHRQYWALETQPGTVLISGMTSKAHEEFREEFEEFIQSFKEN